MPIVRRRLPAPVVATDVPRGGGDLVADCSRASQSIHAAPADFTQPFAASLLASTGTSKTMIPAGLTSPRTACAARSSEVASRAYSPAKHGIIRPGDHARQRLRTSMFQRGNVMFRQRNAARTRPTTPLSDPAASSPGKARLRAGWHGMCFLGWFPHPPEPLACHSTVDFAPLAAGEFRPSSRSWCWLC